MGMIGLLTGLGGWLAGWLEGSGWLTLYVGWFFFWAFNLNGGGECMNIPEKQTCDNFPE